MSSRVSIKPSVTHLNETWSGKEPVRLNEVMQKVLQAQQAACRTQSLIVRCQDLPQVEGDAAQWEQVFSLLLRTITENAVEGGKLFLYIDCEEEHKEVDAALTQGYKRFLLEIHTNMTTTGQWKQVHAPSLAHCSEVLALHSASFTVNEIQNTGCLFSISLLGKL